MLKRLDPTKYMKLDFTTDSNGIAYTFVNGVKGTLNQNDTYTLINEYYKLPVNSIYVETGSYLGCSSVLAGLCTRHGTTIYSHDIWERNMEDLPSESGPPPQCEDYFLKYYENIRNNNLQNIVIPIRGDSPYTLGIHKDESIDLAFIDGDHSIFGTLRDLQAVYPKMKPNGVILCHDFTTHPGVKSAVEQFCKENGITNIDGFGGSSIVKINLSQK